MKKNGFTLTEMLAVLVILGLLIILTIPAYAIIFKGIKRNNLAGKISEIEASALKYADSIKDEIKDAPNSCKNISLEFLIQEGHLISEDKVKDVIMDPTTNSPLTGSIELCYCLESFDVEAYYIVDFDINKHYYVNDVVKKDNKLYKCVIDYIPGSGIDGTVKDNDDNDKNKGKRFFKEIGC